MKTIDTKSLLLGAGIALLFLALTSGKLADENNDIKIFSRNAYLEIYNSKTNMLYEYGSRLDGIKENPINTYKVLPDGSSLKAE